MRGCLPRPSAEYGGYVEGAEIVSLIKLKGAPLSARSWRELMDEATRELVRQRAGNRCEYGFHRQEHAESTQHIEHIVAKQHLGSDDPSNFALACIHGNSHKGPNLTAIDPDSGVIVPLVNPRQDRWADHSTLRGAFIIGLTPTGRTTVYVLAMNARHRLNVRAELIAQGLYP